MKDLTNPAKRILNLVHQIKAMPDQQPMGEAWGEVLGLDQEVARLDSHEVYEKLRFVRNELDLLQKLMRGTTFSSDLYEPYLQRVRNTIAVNNLASPWGNFKSNLHDDTILALKYCSDILPSEPDIDPTELENILSSIHEIKLEIENSSLSKGMYEFLLGQLAIIENAIQNYPIAGGSAIKKAFTEGLADWAAHADDISSATNEDTEKSSKVYGVWGSLKVAGEEFVKADRMANSLMGLVNKGQAVSDSVIGWLTSP